MRCRLARPTESSLHPFFYSSSRKRACVSLMMTGKKARSCVGACSARARTKAPHLLSPSLTSSSYSPPLHCALFGGNPNRRACVCAQRARAHSSTAAARMHRAYPAALKPTSSAKRTGHSLLAMNAAPDSAENKLYSETRRAQRHSAEITSRPACAWCISADCSENCACDKITARVRQQPCDTDAAAATH